MKRIFSLLLLAFGLVAFSPGFTWRYAVALPVASQTAAVISAVNGTGFSAPPNVSAWTAGSYAQLSNIGPGNQVVTVTVNSSAFLGTIGVYYSTDNVTLQQAPNAGILNNESQVYGAISTATATYTVVVPPGTAYIACSAYTSGSAIVTASNGPAYTSVPGTVNPTSALPINLNPYAVCLADIGGAGATVGVEYIDANGTVIPPVDSNGVKWSAITVTLPASGSRGLSFLVLATSPDGSHAISALPTGAVACRLRVITGTANVPTVAVNTGGTTDGSAGTGTNGYATGFNPNTSSPTALFVLDTLTVGRVRS